MANDDTWVIIPVYNEVTVIAQVVADLQATFRNIVCVDDGSTDGSAAQIATTAAHLVRHPINLGQGAALQTGLCYALARPGGRFFVTFDADGQHRVADADRMVDAARSGFADVVLGSRFLDQDVGQRHRVPRAKRIALGLVVALSPVARKMHLTDAHNGLRVRPVISVGHGRGGRLKSVRLGIRRLRVSDGQRSERDDDADQRGDFHRLQTYHASP